MEITLELLTADNLDEARAIDRADVPTAYVDDADALWELTCYGLRHGCIGHTYVIRVDGACAGVILMGEAIPWETDPPEMRLEPFYRIMGFVMDRRYRGQGLGGRALETVISRICADFGVRPVALGVHEENAGAARFYARHGFRPTSAMEGADRYYLRYP